MRKLSVLFCIVLFGTATLCPAQQRRVHNAQKVQQKAPQQKWEVFTGYTLSRTYGMYNYYDVNETNVNTNSYDMSAGFNLQGGQASATYFVRKHFGITADFTALTKTQSITAFGKHITQATHEQDYLFGPTFRYQLKGKANSISLFAHQLFGPAHTSVDLTPGSITCNYSSGVSHPNCSTTQMASVSGGGVDVKLNSHLSIRPVQLDYWNYQVSQKKFTGYGMYSDSDTAKFGVDGFRYSAGAVFNF